MAALVPGAFFHSFIPSYIPYLTSPHLSLHYTMRGIASVPKATLDPGRGLKPRDLGKVSAFMTFDLRTKGARATSALHFDIVF